MIYLADFPCRAYQRVALFNDRSAQWGGYVARLSAQLTTKLPQTVLRRYFDRAARF